MNMNTIIMLAVLVALAVVLVARDGPKGVLEGLKAGGRTIANTWILILIAIAIGGFLTVLVPTELISRYIGGESGFKGLLIGWAVGGIIPGAPYTALPIAGSLLSSGAGVGPVMALVLSSGMGIALTRIPMEIAFIDWRFSLLRLLSAFILPLIGGLIAIGINKVLGLFPG